MTHQPQFNIYVLWIFSGQRLLTIILSLYKISVYVSLPLIYQQQLKGYLPVWNLFIFRRKIFVIGFVTRNMCQSWVKGECSCLYLRIQSWGDVKTGVLIGWVHRVKDQRKCNLVCSVSGKSYLLFPRSPLIQIKR